jgi:hypothetical protein
MGSGRKAHPGARSCLADSRASTMAGVVPRNAGILLLGIWLVLVGLSGLVSLGLPYPLMAGLAFLAGLLILIGQ